MADSDLQSKEVLTVFRMYIGIKLHFNSKKFIYHPNFNSKKFDENSMNKRKDVAIFVNLTDKWRYKIDDLKTLMISTFKHNQDAWIGCMNEKEYEIINEKRRANILNLTHNVGVELSKLDDLMITKKLSLIELLKITDNDRPGIIKYGRFSDEFLALLNQYIDFCDQKTDNPLWNKRQFMIEKYGSIIETYNDSAINLIESYVKENI